jgi:hypothetical protein
MDGGGSSWGIINIVGPLLLLAVLAWAVLRNRGRAKGGVTEEETDRATRELYRQEDAAHRRDGDEAP